MAALELLTRAARTQRVARHIAEVDLLSLARARRMGAALTIWPRGHRAWSAALHPALHAGVAVHSGRGVLQLPRALIADQPLGLEQRSAGSLRARRLFVGLLLDLHLEVEEQTDGLLLDALHHRREQVEPLTLVLHQRLLLRERAQTDALTQVVHLVQVLAPLAVQHRQQHPTLQLTHDVRAQLLLAPGV